MTTGDTGRTDPRPHRLPYEAPPRFRPPAPHRYADPAARPAANPKAGSSVVKPPFRPAAVRPGPLFGLTIAGFFVLLASAVVVIVTVVGR